MRKLATFARITGDFHRNYHQTFAHFAAAALLANQTADGFFLDLDLLPFGMEMGYPVRHAQNVADVSNSLVTCCCRLDS